MPNAMTSEEKLSWMINVLRSSISLDWAKLATELLTPGERRTITQRLVASTRALKEIKNTFREIGPCAQPRNDTFAALLITLPS